jgi:hypothetical protein
MSKKVTQRHLKLFVDMMLPRMDVKDSDIIKLVILKNDTPDVEQMFSNMIQDSIELLIQSKEIRELAQA